MTAMQPAPSSQTAMPAGQPAAAVILRDLVVSYQPGKPVLKGVSLEIPDSSVTAIIGPSGTGKSTLIRSINRLVTPTSGDIIFEGENIAKIRGSRLRAIRAKIGMVFQEYNLVERLTVMENVLTGRLSDLPVWRVWLRQFPADDLNRAFDLLAQVGLDGYAAQRADALSGGQRQRVGIARALMQNPRLLLADEPTSSLDPKTSVEIMDLMTSLARARGVPLIVNMHQVDLAKRFADRIVGMSGGNVVFDGPPDTLANHHLQEIYGGEGWLT